MGFYIKIVHKNKIKKYLIQNPSQIKFNQIKQCFGLKNIWKDSFYHFEIISNEYPLAKQQTQYYTEKQLIEKLNSMEVKQKECIKIKIVEKESFSQQQRRRKQSVDSLQVPTSIQKKRSRSVELNNIFEMGCHTDVFDVTSSINIEQSVFNKLEQSQDQKSELNQPYIFMKQAQSQKINCFYSSHKSLDSNDENKLLYQSLMVNSHKKKKQIQMIEEKIKQRKAIFQKQSKIQQTDQILNLLNM